MTQAMSLVFVETDKAIVLVFLVDHISRLVGWNAVMGFSLDSGNMRDMWIKSAIFTFCDTLLVLFQLSTVLKRTVSKCWATCLLTA